MWRWGMAVMVGMMMSGVAVSVCAAEREPMTMRVVAVNPSAEKTKTVPVRIDLPQEIKPADILDQGDLDVEYDTEHSLYFVHKEDVVLAPKQTLVFEVVVKDVWFIPDTDLAGLKNHAQILTKRLEKSEYRDAAMQLGTSIIGRLDEIQKGQEDESIGKKQHIGAYRRNLLALGVIKEDLTRMEKLLSFAGGPPVPRMLEESPLKSDAPSTTTTWLVIFLILIFMALFAGQFFFTWQRRLKTVSGFSEEQEAPGPDAMPDDRGPSGQQPTER